MNAAIIYIKENEELLAKARYLDTSLIANTINKLNKTSVDMIYLVNGVYKQANVITDKTLEEAIEDINGRNGKTLIISPFYPNLESYHYETLLLDDSRGKVLEGNDGFINVYMIQNDDLIDYDKKTYESLKIENQYALKINSLKELYYYGQEKKLQINKRHLESGVNIMDLENTYIGERVSIAKGVTVYPNVHLDGKTEIGKNTILTEGTHIVDSTIGENNYIESSHIEDSIVHDNSTVGPFAHLRGHSEVMNYCRIGNFVEFKNTKFGEHSCCAHLTYLGDSDIGEYVNMGCGVVTVNYDGVHKYHTTVKDHAFIGSNSNLIAPVTVGEYAVIAAGSTITDNVDDKDMAIARARQVIIEGRGYKYIKKEK